MSDAATPAPASTSAASNDNVMAAVATIPLVGLIIYYAMPEASAFVKFYAKQSIGLLLVSVGISLVSFVVGLVPFLGWIISFLISLLGLAVFVMWLILLINAIQGNKYRLPFVADLSDKLIK